MQNHRNHNHNQRYQYKGIWIEIFIEADFENNTFAYHAYIELPREEGCLTSNACGSREEAEFAAEELIDSWN